MITRVLIGLIVLGSYLAIHYFITEDQEEYDNEEDT